MSSGPSHVPIPSPEVTQNIIRAHRTGTVPDDRRIVPDKNIGDLLRRQAEIHRGKIWMVFYSDETGRHEYSYGEFYDLVSRTANLLLDQGIRPGERIATFAFNHADTVIQYFGAWLIGAVVIPINVAEDDKRIRYILRDSGTRLAFVRQPYLERFDTIAEDTPALDVIIVVSDTSPVQRDSNRPDFHNILRHSNPKLTTPRSVNPDDDALIVYTSGTTGQPKGVVLTHYNLLVDAHAIAVWHGMTPDHRMMCVLPIHHVNGTVVTLLTPLSFGGSVVLNQKFHSHTFFERIGKECVHVVSVVPTLLQFLLHEDPDMGRYDLRNFRHFICGAGPLTVELAVQFERRFGIPIIHGYGLSETTCYSCFLPTDLTPAEHTHWLSRLGFPSIGVPIHPNEMDIHDEDGGSLPEGEKGEIVIRGHNVMKEYHANPEANEKAFTHGWFRSGDEGFYRVDGKGRRFFFITGRIKELIIRGGVNISPFEIDEILMNAPGVRTGLAIGFDNDWYGEEVGAYIQAKDGIIVNEEEVLAYCRGFLPYSKCPKVVIVGNDVPVTSTGKYQRSKLKHLFAPWKPVQFGEGRHPEKD